MFDVQKLGAINDSLGRYVGDRLLEKIAMRLKQTHSESETIAYFGGGTFAMMLGTALTAMPASQALAAESDGSARAFNDISRYCTACWRNARLHPDCWTDCTQEVFCRLLERVPTMLEPGWRPIPVLPAKAEVSVRVLPLAARAEESETP